MVRSIVDSLKDIFAAKEPINIGELLAHRTDLSTFIVHLTKHNDVGTASESLASIIESWKIEARSTLGYDTDFLKKSGVKVVSFTETPLEYLYILTEKIKGRQCEFMPYGIAITKKITVQRNIKIDFSY